MKLQHIALYRRIGMIDIIYITLSAITMAMTTVCLFPKFRGKRLLWIIVSGMAFSTAVTFAFKAYYTTGDRGGSYFAIAIWVIVALYDISMAIWPPKPSQKK